MRNSDTRVEQYLLDRSYPYLLRLNIYHLKHPKISPVMQSLRLINQHKPLPRKEPLAPPIIRLQLIPKPTIHLATLHRPVALLDPMIQKLIREPHSDHQPNSHRRHNKQNLESVVIVWLATGLENVRSGDPG